MDDSTKKMSRMLGTERAESAVHLYLYMRYLPHYVYHMGKKTPFIRRPPETEIPHEAEEMIEILANRVMREIVSVESSTYHGKVMPLELATQLVQVEEDIEIRDLSESIIPYPIARDIVLEYPQNIAVFECACRSLQEEPCLPLDVCLVVGDPLASFVVDNQVMNARKVTSEEAIAILEAEHRRGHVQAAYFKDVADGRFWAICNCCSCCCLGLQVWNNVKLPMICASGYRAEVSGDCTGCGDCAERCPFFAISVEDVAVVDDDKCMGCGVCEGACDAAAIALVLDPAKGEPLNMRKLIAERKSDGD
jgi:ferredoxin